VASERPDSFAQALQLAYLSNFADRMDTPGDASSYGRLDQLLLPFYRADLEGGALTEDDAFDLVCHFAARQWGRQISNNITVGGLRPDGTDATNPVSLLLLEAMEATGLELDLSVRLHEGSPERFVRTVARVLRRGFGRPSVYNDEVTVPALIEHGVAPEDARDYAPLGCVEVMIPGRSAFRTMGMGMNLPKVLELTLNQGRCLVTGDTVWDDVPAHYDSFESLREEYHRRVRDVVRLAVDVIREDECIEHKFRPRPWLTVLSRGGIRDALDVTAGQPKYDPVGVTLDGIADIANSLCAVQRLVFEEGRLSLGDLRSVLRADWDGREALRQLVLNRLPRFGRDEEEVDALAREEADHYARCFEDLRTEYGGRFWPMIFGVGTSLIHWKGPRTGATASGRRRTDSLAMSLQPSPAGAQGSTTALLCSVAAVDFGRFPGGVSNVQELDPALFEGEAGLTRLVELIRGFFAMGGMEFAPNFISEDTLRAARAEPERFRHLTVRLFGLSSYFVSLSRDVQEQVIERVAAAGRRQD
jgi:formate C-acetyltransferase